MLRTGCDVAVGVVIVGSVVAAVAVVIIMIVHATVDLFLFGECLYCIT